MGHPVNEKCGDLTYPSPVRAQQDWICHLCFRMDCRFRLFEISAADMQPFTSCNGRIFSNLVLGREGVIQKCSIELITGP